MNIPAWAAAGEMLDFGAHEGVAPVMIQGASDLDSRYHELVSGGVGHGESGPPPPTRLAAFLSAPAPRPPPPPAEYVRSSGNAPPPSRPAWKSAGQQTFGTTTDLAGRVLDPKSSLRTSVAAQLVSLAAACAAAAAGNWADRTNNPLPAPTHT